MGPTPIEPVGPGSEIWGEVIVTGYDLAVCVVLGGIVFCDLNSADQQWDVYPLLSVAPHEVASIVATLAMEMVGAKAVVPVAVSV